MAGKIIATFQVRVTLREENEGDLEAGNVEVPTNKRVEEVVYDILNDLLLGRAAVHVKSERTDQ